MKIPVKFVIFYISVIICPVSMDTIVTTKYGRIRGITSSKTRAFLGVPFAAPPEGNLRWKNPEEPKAWSPSVYNATSLKPGCPQARCELTFPPYICPKTTSEDCLYLYIWTPLRANPTTKYPVMVYIHGGNFVGMTAGSILYDGENMAYKGQVIIVNVEYRLGALGYLLTPDTPMGKGATGNYGILDQRLALKWVKENIQSFGGDSNQVTLFGQSAGAQSVLIHMMTKESAQYFHRAIVESAPIAIPFKTPKEMIFLSNMLASDLKCTAGDLKCLNNRTVDQIIKAQVITRKYPSSFNFPNLFEPWLPFVDGKVVPSQLLEAFGKGYFVEKPLVIGTLTEESRSFIYAASNKPLSVSEYLVVLLLTFQHHVIPVIFMYPPVLRKDQRDTLQAPGTDFIFTCPTRNYSQKAVLRNGGKVWHYIYDHAFSFDGWGKHLSFCKGHVCHGAELPLVFDTVSLTNFTMTVAENRLSSDLIAYFTNFAKTSDPNVGLSTSIKWPSYSAKANWPYLHFKTPEDTVGVNYRKKYCDFLDRFGYNV